MSVVVPVRLQADPTRPGTEVVLPAAVAEPLGLRDGMGVWVGFGRARCLAMLRVDPASGSWPSPSSPSPTPLPVLVAPAVGRALRLPLPLSLFVRVQPGRDGIPRRRPALDIGPLVGILAREPLTHVRHYIEGARLAGAEAFFMGIGHVRWAGRAVTGYRLTEAGWQRWTYPLPHVIYDRAPGRWKADGKALFFRRLARAGTVTFNGAVGYKWELHRRLWAIPDLRAHLPRTGRIRHPAAVMALLARWGPLFLKPHRGHQGRGIWRVAAVERDRYRLTSAHHAEEVVVGRARLMRFLHGLLLRGPYLAQQEIALAQFQGAVWDARALVVRDETGCWQLGGIAARLGRRGRIVSNLHQGGRPAALPPILTELFGDDGPRLLAELGSLALRVARGVQSFAPLAGELGVDLGVDREGKAWLIEVNPKPGRQSFVSLAAPEDKPRLYGLPFRYARFLAGFGSGGSDLLAGVSLRRRG